jgi:Zn-dependent peptidase ImmA (M78 family)
MTSVTDYEWVIPKTLRAARERLRLSHEEVAEQADRLGDEYSGITANALASWEAGRKEPELRHLEALSEIYVCPVGWFFLPEIPRETSGLDFRGVAPGAKVGAPGMQTLSRFLELADWAEDVALRTGKLRSPAIGEASLSDNLEQVVARERKRLGFASEIRSEWESSEDAFGWWRRRIEGLGVYCFMMRLTTSEVRGASYWGEHGAPFILVNSEDAESATGRTFTLLHEYAHLILRESLVCDFRGSNEGVQVERFANRFAARMLLSRTELTERLHELDACHYRDQWGDSFLDRIREPFFVSRDVIAIYLQELEYAPDDFYQGKRAAWAGRGGFGRAKNRVGRKQGEQRLRSVGNALAKVLTSKEAEEAVSPLELADRLDIKVERVPEVLAVFRRAGVNA